jgi:hypothetical protein
MSTCPSRPSVPSTPDSPRDGTELTTQCAESPRNQAHRQTSHRCRVGGPGDDAEAKEADISPLELYRRIRARWPAEAGPPLNVDIYCWLQRLKAVQHVLSPD